MKESQAQWLLMNIEEKAKQNSNPLNTHFWCQDQNEIAEYNKTFIMQMILLPKFVSKNFMQI